MNRSTTETQTGLKVIAQEETTEYSLLFEVNTDETECVISCHQKNPPVVIKAKELFNTIIQAGIKKEFISIDAVSKFCVDLKDGNDPGRMLVARGYLPTPGPDGLIEINVSTTTDKAHYIIDEKGQIDYRSRHAIANVSTGQKVAVIRPPQNGPPGSTVRGYEGVNILVDNIKDDINVNIQGSVSIIKDPLGSGLKKLSLTPLQVTEKELLAKLDEQEPKPKSPAD